MYRTNGYRIPALYFYMQFILMEPSTKRSVDASKKIYFLLYQNIKNKKNGDVNVFVDPEMPKDEGDFSSLELALSLSAAASMEDK